MDSHAHDHAGTLSSFGDRISDVLDWTGEVVDEATDEPVLNLYGAATSHVGEVRRRNEDAFLVAPALHLVALADGMGGHRGGHVASALALETLRDRLVVPILDGRTYEPHHARDRIQRLERALQEANQRIIQRGRDDPSVAGLGTTIVTVWIGEDGAVSAHVGDSRVYRYRDALVRITHDHSVAAEIRRQSGGGAEIEPTGRLASVLTRALGGHDAGVDVEFHTFDLRPDDRLLLCSDGLTDVVAEDDIAALLALDEPPPDIARALVDAALAAGGPDNVTVVVVKAEALSRGRG